MNDQDKLIRLRYENAQIEIVVNADQNKPQMYKDIAMATLRQMNKSRTGREQLRDIRSILQAWSIDDQRVKK